MSKLMDLIERAGKAAPAALGFRAAVQQSQTPSIPLIASFAHARKAGEVAQAKVNAALFASSAADTEAIEEVARRLGTLPWGLQLGDASAEKLAGLREKGCDFFVFQPTGVALEGLEEGEMGRVLLVPLSLEERLARVVEDLPVDAVLLAEQQRSPVDLGSLMALGALRILLGKPFLVSFGNVPTSWELECLRDMDVNGVVADMEQIDAAMLQELQARLESLPRRKPKGEKPAAFVPRLSLPGRSLREEEEEEEDDDE
ncbi:MAG: hypothetical protein HY686_00560 [Chloroflexi bacterium]|nr:hypothetical protein [Chloroflexota bacterium]